MSVFTKSAAAKAARWSAVPAIAAAAIALTAGSALAEGTAIGITTYSGSVWAGQLHVSGAYQCSTASAYDYLEVTAVQEGPNGPVRSTEYEQMPCTGTTLTWQATLGGTQDAWFGDGNTRVDVTLWTPGEWGGRADASMVIWA
jgi:hypothetical protein